MPVLLPVMIFAVLAIRAFPQACQQARPCLLPPGTTALGLEIHSVLGAPGALLGAALEGWTAGRPLVALTFDDGPYPLYTPALLDVLRRQRARATFFLTGSGARDFPELARQIVEEGHEVGNHTFSHRQESELTRREMEVDLLAAEEAIARATGERTRLLRPAGGRLTPDLLDTAGHLGYTIVLETVNPGDWWVRDPRRLYRGSFQGRLREGVILLHSGTSSTIRVLPTVLDELRSRDFHFVTVSELARAKGLRVSR